MVISIVKKYTDTHIKKNVTHLKNEASVEGQYSIKHNKMIHFF